MIKVFQTKYGKGQGNCFTACVASILEVQIDTLPEFCDHEGGKWFEHLYEYCKANSMFLLHWQHVESVPMIALNAYVIVDMELEGVSDEHHAVVGLTRFKSSQVRPDGTTVWEWETDIVHDPNRHGTPPYKQPVGYVMLGRQSGFNHIAGVGR